MVGKKILHYQLIDRLGAGGMGEIFKAEDSRLNRLVAIKILSPGMASDADRRRRFYQEAQAASALNHPNIITLYDIVAEDDMQCIVMEYIAGKTLRDLIPAGGLPPPQALQYAAQIASALTAAHAAGIIHRDLKPSNIMVNTSGLIKVLDFGLAKWVDAGVSGQPGDQGTVEAALTREGSIIGTVSYMSPEQAEGKRVDGRSDIFSFGSVLYEMVTGKRAFEGRSGISTLSSILRDDVKPIYEAAPDVPPLLEQIVLRCLLKDPGARWQSMKEIEGALVSLQRQLDPEGRYPSPISTAHMAFASAPLTLPPELLEPSPASAPVAVASASPLSNPSVGVAPPPSKPPVFQNGPTKKTGPTKSAEFAPPHVHIPPPPRASKNPPPRTASSSSKLVIIILGLIGAVLLAGAGVGGWYWWKSHQPPPTPANEAGLPSAAPPAIPPVQTAPPVENPSSTTPPIETDASKLAKSKRAQKAKGDKMLKTLPKIPAPVAPTPILPPPPVLAPALPKSAPHPLFQTTTVMVSDALPFEIQLAEDVPMDAPDGQPLRFTVTIGLLVGDKLVIARGATVTGAVTGEQGKKKFLGIGGGRKLTFRLTQADAVDGRKLAVRALPGKSGDGPTMRSFETAKNGSKTKGFAAMQGTVYIAYIDGDQIVAVRK